MGELTGWARTNRRLNMRRSRSGLKSLYSKAKRRGSFLGGDLRRRLKRRWLLYGYRLYQRMSQWRRYKKERARVSKEIGYEPTLQNPETINEKILWKKIHDRSPLLTRTTDKVEVRNYVREKLGGVADTLLIPLLHVAADPSDLPLTDCPVPFVVKANHAWNTNLFVHERRRDGWFVASAGGEPRSLWNRREVIDQCNRWLNHTHGFADHQWAYSGIDRKVFIEPLLADAFEGKYPEAKIDCFHGVPTYILGIAHHDGGRAMSLLDAKGNRLDVQAGIHGEVPDDILVDLRAQIPTLRRYAARLAEDFDYCRVDFYVTPEGPRFSEITHYPCSGARTMIPQDFDREIGSHWKIPHAWDRPVENEAFVVT